MTRTGWIEVEGRSCEVEGNGSPCSLSEHVSDILYSDWPLLGTGTLFYFDLVMSCALLLKVECWNLDRDLCELMGGFLSPFLNMICKEH